jgi:hypothetical protein
MADDFMINCHLDMGLFLPSWHVFEKRSAILAVDESKDGETSRNICQDGRNVALSLQRWQEDMSGWQEVHLYNCQDGRNVARSLQRWQEDMPGWQEEQNF